MPTTKLDQTDLAAALAAVAKHGSIAAGAKAMNIPRATLQHRLRVAKANGVKPQEAPATKRAGRSLDDFRAAHDKDFIVPAKIKEGLKALGGGWEYEVAFAKLAGVSLTDLSSYRDAFSAHVVAVKRDGKRAWAGTAATAEKMRGMVS